MIRACLQGDAAKRPTVAQILAHRLFDPTAPALAPMQMRYNGFLPHVQAEASGIVGTVNTEYAKRGLHNLR